MAGQKQENPLLSILFNIVLPVAILNQVSDKFGEQGPTIALLLALVFPVAYGLMDYIKRGHKNYVSLLGVVNVLFTGGLALMELEGFWFAVKEAAFPLVLAIAVYLSILTKNPAIKLLAYNENVLNIPLIEQKLQETGKHKAFEQHLRKSTALLSVSFLISSVLNFILARSIFQDIDPTLPALERTTILNEQIAHMTWKGYLVIALPLMGFMLLIMWHLLSGIKKFTSLDVNEILPQSK